MSALQVRLQGVAVLAPGLAGWAGARAVFAGEAPYAPQPTVVPTPQRLPAAERRRAGATVKLALALAEDACSDAGLDPATLATVFASSSGDGANCHALCEMLAGDDRLVSPTRFTNSVHNAAAGYWHIATHNMQASTSLCAHDDSFAAGLLEAALQVRASGAPVLLVCGDAPYPEPLNAVRPLPDSVGLALVLAPVSEGRGAAASLRLAPATAATPCSLDALEALRQRTPAGRALPLLEALARRQAGVIAIGHTRALALQVELDPGR